MPLFPAPSSKLQQESSSCNPILELQFVNSLANLTAGLFVQDASAGCGDFAARQKGNTCLQAAGGTPGGQADCLQALFSHLSGDVTSLANIDASFAFPIRDSIFNI